MRDAGGAMTARLTPPTTRTTPFDRRNVVIATGTALVLLIVTLAFAAATPLRFAVFSPELDLASHTIGTLVCAAVAALSYSRFKESGRVEGLFQASAFLVLAIANLANTIVVTLDIDARLGLGLGLASPGQVPLYAWAVARLLTAALLAAGAVVPRELGTRLARHSLAFLWLPTVALVVAACLLWWAQDRLPILVDPAMLALLADETFALAPLPGVNVGIIALDGAAAVLLIVGAIAYARNDRGTGGVPRTYLVVGLVIAAFSQIHFILYPAVYSGLVSTGDILRIAFYVVLIAGIHAGTTADVRALRTANSRLRLLAGAEADRTAIAERARLARELHDGISQDLWSMKLEFDPLAEVIVDREPALEPRVRRVQSALDSAIREARAAVDTLRAGFDAGLSFADELPRRLDAFVERTGYVVDLEIDPRVGRLPGVAAADLLRIVDEALHNVQKHADATRIRVRVARDGDTLVVSVEDNGRGFHPGNPRAGHGLPGMRERAALLGGRLDVRSAPGDGTSVAVRLPADAVTG
jgi:signal transduction histidine kinase